MGAPLSATRLRAAAELAPLVSIALDLMAQGSSIVALVLPGSAPSGDERDPGLEEVIARVCHRILERGARSQGQRPLDENDPGVTDAHVLSGQAARAALQEAGLDRVPARTPELWQGEEVPIMVVEHPFSVGSAAPSDFDLDPGRFCVMLSRHLLACIIVARESVGSSIDGYMHDSRPMPIGAKDKAWAGFKSHATVWRTLNERCRIVRLAH